MDTVKLVMLGTGTPNLDPDRSGPCVAVTVGERAYLFDFGPGVARRLSQAYKQGNSALKPANISVVFATHLHSDHTGGYSDLIFSTWVAGRRLPLQLYGPKGIFHMTDHILSAYSADIHERANGLEGEDFMGAEVCVTEIAQGVVYTDAYVKIQAISVPHGGLPSFAYKLFIGDKTILISGDTAPCAAIEQAAVGCDILVHEVYSAAGLCDREPKWQKYHSTVHTSTTQLGQIAQKAQPKLLVLYHQLYMFDIEGADPTIPDKMAEREQEMIGEIRAFYQGELAFSRDLDVFTLD